jgi:hypothetical protein
VRSLDIRERLEHEALNSTDSRSRIAALRELARMDTEPATRADTIATSFRFATGSVMLEPRPEGKIRMWLRTPRGWEDLFDEWLTPRQAVAVLVKVVLEREREAAQPAEV